MLGLLVYIFLNNTTDYYYSPSVQPSDTISIPVRSFTPTASLNVTKSQPPKPWVQAWARPKARPTYGKKRALEETQEVNVCFCFFALIMILKSNYWRTGHNGSHFEVCLSLPTKFTFCDKAYQSEKGTFSATHTKAHSH